MERSFRIVFILCTAITFLPLQAFAAPKKSKGNVNASATSITTERTKYPDNFNSVINSAYDSVSLKDYSGAVNIFLQNNFGEDIFSSYKASFPTKKDGREILAVTEQALKDIKNQLPQYNSLAAELNPLVDEFLNAAKKKNTDQMDSALVKISSSVTKYATFRNSIALKCEELKKASDRTVNSLNLSGDANYTLLALKWVSGLEGAEGSGVMGAVNGYYDYIIQTIYNSYFELLKEESKKYSASVSKLKINDFTSENTTLLANLKNMELLGSQAKKAVNFYSFHNGKYGSKAFSNSAKSESSLNFIINISTQTTLLCNLANTLCTELNKANTQEVPSDPVKIMRDGKDTYSGIVVNSAATISDIGKTATASKNFTWFTEYNSYEESFKLWNEERNAYLGLCNLLVNDSTTNATKLWIKTANWFVKAGNEMVEANKATYKMLEENLTNPQYVLSELDSFAQVMENDISILKKCDSYLDQGYQFRSNFTNQRKEFNNSISKLNNIVNDCSKLRDSANANHTQATVAKNQIDFYYSRAKTSFSKGDFTQAHNNLDRANDAYSSVIDSLKKDIKIQQQCYESLVSLRKEFIEKEKPILINEVRRYKNEAKTYYYAGEFDQANALLSKAESRRAEWAKLMDTTLDADDELQRIKEMVNTALSIKEGRIIYPEDPLYPEMSQLLSIANQYYNSGVKLLNSGNKTQGKEELNLSKEKLNELKLVYPRNQEASILSLKIDRLLDPQAFENMFAEKVNSLKKVKYSLKDSVALEAYNDLQDLYQINPAYPGLKTFIYDIEIDLGIRQKPVSNTNNQKAQSLATQAKTILASAGRDETLLNSAKAKANEALNLNPDNDLAIQVLDEISLRSGGEAAVVLSAADEELYQSAIRDLQSGNVFAAKQKIDKLMENPKNKRSAKILKLQKRIEASL